MENSKTYIKEELNEILENYTKWSVNNILASYKIINKRNAALMRAYNSIELSFDQYRKRVAEQNDIKKGVYECE